jgi:hypothetical protein
VRLCRGKKYRKNSTESIGLMKVMCDVYRYVKGMAANLLAGNFVNK